jgi:hypothetical protein
MDWLIATKVKGRNKFKPQRLKVNIQNKVRIQKTQKNRGEKTKGNKKIS